jgi:hypothetical protein
VNPQIVGGHDDPGDVTAGFRSTVDVLDHRMTVEIGERLAGKACRGKSSGDDSDDVLGKW